MDRISALRNVEEALREFEEGAADLASTERRVITVLRTYATEFGDDEGMAAYRATGADRVEGLVVVASSADEATDRVRELVDDPPPFDVERVD